MKYKINFDFFFNAKLLILVYTFLDFKIRQTYYNHTVYDTKHFSNIFDDIL